MFRIEWSKELILNKRNIFSLLSQGHSRPWVATIYKPSIKIQFLIWNLIEYTKEKNYWRTYYITIHVSGECSLKAGSQDKINYVYYSSRVNMKLNIHILFFLLSVAQLSISVCAYNILAVFPHPGKSHQFVFGPIIRQLVKRGHNLTVIVHYTYNVKDDNYKEILLGDVNKTGESFFDLKSLHESVFSSQVKHPFLLTNIGLKSCETLLSNAGVGDLIQTKRKFDLIIAEFFNSECVLGFVHKFEAPLIGVSTGILMPWHGDRLGNPDNPSYIPCSHLGQSNQMGFTDRLFNFLGIYWYKLIYWWKMADFHKMVEEKFQRKLPPFDELMKNISLLLVNSHVSFTFSRPLVPGIIEVGGVHIGNSKLLPAVSSSNI